MTRRWVVLFVSAFIACDDGTVSTLRLPADFPDQFVSALVAAHSAEMIVHAAPLSDPIVLEGVEGEVDLIEMIALEGSLEELGLQAGRVRADVGSARTAASLIDEDSGVYQANLDVDGMLHSIPAGELSPSFRNFELPTLASQCAEILDIEPVAVDTDTTSVVGMVPLSGDRVLLASKIGEFFVYDGVAARKVEASPAEIPPRLGMDPSGQIWAAGDEIWRIEMVNGIPTGTVAFSGPPGGPQFCEGGGDVLWPRFVVLADGTFLGIDGAGALYAHKPNEGWSVLHTFGPQGCSGTVGGDGVQLAAAGAAGSREVVFFDGDRVDVVQLSESRDAGLRSIDYLPGFGFLVSTVGGEVFQRVEDRWEQLVDTNGIRIRIIYPFGQGFVLGGDSGYFAQYINGQTCTLSTGIGINPERALPRPDGRVLFSGTRVGEQASPDLVLLRFSEP